MTAERIAGLPPSEAGERPSQTGPLERPPCAMCDGTAFEVVHGGCKELLHWLPGRFDIVRCRGCGLMQTNPRPVRDEIGAYYPSSYTSYSPPTEKVTGRARRWIKWLVQVPYVLRYGRPDQLPSGRGKRLLDVGSGAGDFAARMAALGWSVAIIEPNAELAEQTRARLGLSETDVFAGSAEDAVFEQSSFDMVSMSHVLEHLHDPRGVLEKVHGWLRPGGELHLGVPNAASWEARLFGRLWHGLDVPRHLYHFDPLTLRRFLGLAGFDVRRIVPQPQTGSLASSLLHLGRAPRASSGRRHPYRRPKLLYYATLLPGSVLLALGNSAYLNATATRR